MAYGSVHRQTGNCVVTWHRKGFRLFWTWKVHRGQPAARRCLCGWLWAVPRRPPQAFHCVLIPRNPLMGQIPALGAALDGASCFVRIYLQRDLSCQNLPTTGRLSYRAPLNGYVYAITAFNNGQHHWSSTQYFKIFLISATRNPYPQHASLDFGGISGITNLGPSMRQLCSIRTNIQFVAPVSSMNLRKSTLTGFVKFCKNFKALLGVSNLAIEPRRLTCFPDQLTSLCCRF